jgi:divalent metal cation (Fe/Co/Zn/Cd) transporter
MLIGLLLTFVAILLGRESGALLVDKRANRTIVKRIRQILSADKSVKQMQLGPDQVLFAVDVKFRDELKLEEVESIINRLEAQIRRREPTAKRIFIEVEALRPKRETSRATRASGDKG